MKTGKITAKLRDAVPVCLMAEGEEVKRYKNIGLPYALKEVEITDFNFNVHMDGKITFEIYYERGVLPKVFPEARTRMARAGKAAVKSEGKVAETEEADIPAQAETALTILPEAPVFAPTEAEETVKEAVLAAEEATEAMVEATEQVEEPADNAEVSTMEIYYNATGLSRKELATAVGNFLDTVTVYQKAPTYAFAIGQYAIARNGALTGAEIQLSTEALAEQGFTVA